MATNTQLAEIPKKAVDLTVKPVEVKPIKNLQYMRDKDRERVKGIFRFYEVPGGSMSFCFKAYKGDPVERFDLADGEVYSIPLGVAKHLNKNGAYPVYEHIPGEPGVKTGGYTPNMRATNKMSNMKIARKVHRFGFQSLEFIDPEGLEPTPDLYTVEKTKKEEKCITT